MATRVKVGASADLPPGQARVVEAAGKVIALVNAGGQFYAVNNACLHRGGPVGEGELEGLVLTCPWHGWRWDVKTGASVNNPAMKLTCYPVTVDQGAVWVEV
jgi:3-phenylpropionate/trans-cinnamate dioxygenase ferredoxin component